MWVDYRLAVGETEYLATSLSGLAKIVPISELNEVELCASDTIRRGRPIRYIFEASVIAITIGLTGITNKLGLDIPELNRYLVDFGGSVAMISAQPYIHFYIDPIAAKVCTRLRREGYNL